MLKWFIKTSNEVVLQRAGIENVATFISRNRLRWFGHVARMPSERLPKKLLQWKPAHGKRCRGRPRKSWLNCVTEDYKTATKTAIKTATKTATGLSPNIGDLIISAGNRKEWRTLATSKTETTSTGGRPLE